MPAAVLPTKLDRAQLVALVAALLIEIEGGRRPSAKEMVEATEDALEIVKSALAVVAR